MAIIIIANIIALVASIIMVYTGVLKNKKKILFFQTVQIGLSVISNFLLGGITGGLINILCCLRNILCYLEKLNVIWKLILTILSTVLTLCFNNLGIIGLLPFIGTVIYLWLMNLKDVEQFKWLIVFNTVLWFIYDFYIMSYTSAIFDFSNIVANMITIYQIRKNKLKKAKVN